MSYTPLEQNSVDLQLVLNAINDLPEYEEIAPEVSTEFFSLYDTTQIEEYLDVVNLDNDTSFAPSGYTEGTTVTIKDSTSQSAGRSVSVDVSNYTYVATLEWFVVPVYSSPLSVARMVSKAGVACDVFSRNGSKLSFAERVDRYVNSSGYESELAVNYGIATANNNFTTYNNGIIYFTLPAITVRSSASNTPLTALQAIDAENTNIYFRTRLFRLPKEQFLNKMYTMCNAMISDEEFEGA